MHRRRHGASPRRLTPVERYDSMSGTPLLEPRAHPSPFFNGFLAAEQFNNHAHRANENSICTKESSTNRARDLPYSLPAPKENNDCVFADALSMDQSSSADTTYEVFAETKEQEISCDAIPSIFPPFSPSKQKETPSTSTRHRRHLSADKKKRSQSRTRPSRIRKDECTALCDDGSLRCQNSGGGHAMSWGKRLEDCMVSVDVYKNQCIATDDSCEESKEQQASTFPTHSQFGDQNSVIDDEGAMGEQNRGFQPTDGFSGLLPKSEQINEHPSGQSVDAETPFANTLREFRLNRFFQSENDTGTVEVPVPEMRLTTALTDLEARDNTIKMLQADLEQAKNQLAQKGGDTKKTSLERSVSNDDWNASSSLMSLRTEVVFLRSQLADSKAELLRAKSWSNTVELDQELQSLKKELDQSRNKMANVNTLKQQLQQAKDQITELSWSAAEDAQLFRESSDKLSQALEQAKAELTKLRNEAFDKTLQLAQAESRAKRLEHKTGNIQVSEQSEACTNTYPAEAKDNDGDIQSSRVLEKSLEIEEASQEIVRLSLQLAKATARNDVQAEDLVELESLRSAKAQLQEEIARLIIQKEQHDELYENEKARHKRREDSLETGIEKLQRDLDIHLAENRNMSTRFRDQLTKAELNLECESDRFKAKEAELQAKCQKLEAGIKRFAERSVHDSDDLAIFREQLRGANMQCEELKSRTLVLATKEQECARARDVLVEERDSYYSSVLRMSEKGGRQKELCRSVADHHMRRLSQTCHELQFFKTKISKANIEKALITQELLSAREENNSLKVAVRDISIKNSRLETESLPAIESSVVGMTKFSRVQVGLQSESQERSNVLKDRDGIETSIQELTGECTSTTLKREDLATLGSTTIAQLSRAELDMEVPVRDIHIAKTSETNRQCTAATEIDVEKELRSKYFALIQVMSAAQKSSNQAGISEPRLCYAELEAKCSTLEEELESRICTARKPSNNDNNPARLGSKGLASIEEESQALPLEAEPERRRSNANQNQLERNVANAVTELQKLELLLRKVWRTSLASELATFMQLKRMQEEFEKVVATWEKQSLYIGSKTFDVSWTTQSERLLTIESFHTCDPSPPRRPSLDPLEIALSDQSCTLNAELPATPDFFNSSFQTCASLPERTMSIDPLRTSLPDTQCIPKRLNFTKQLDALWKEVKNISKYTDETMLPPTTEGTVQFDSLDSANPNKADQLKTKLRQKEVDFKRQIVSLSEDANKGAASETNDIDTSNAQIRESKNVCRLAEEIGQRQVFESEKREHDLVVQVEELKKSNLKHQESSASFRQELGEILKLLQETKERWREDAQRFEEEREDRTEKEVKLLAEIKVLKVGLMHAGCLSAQGPSSDFQTRVASFSRCDQMTWASPARTTVSYPDDEPPMQFKTPQRNNRSSQPPTSNSNPMLADLASFSGVIDATREVSSVSTITCGKARSDVTLSILSTSSATGSMLHDAVVSDTLSWPPKTQESFSNASESSILSPPLLSAAVALTNLPEPKPVRIPPPYSKDGKASAGAHSAVPSELVSRLKSYFT